MHIGPAHHPDQVLGGGDQQVEPLLLTDHADIADEVLRALLQLGLRRAQFQLLDLRAGADDEHVLGLHPAPPARDLGIAFIGGDGDGRGLEGQPFEDHHRLPEQAALVEFRLVKFGADVVVVEQIAHSEEPHHPGDQEDQVGRIAAMQDVDAAFPLHPQRQPELVPQRRAVFAQIAAGGIALGRQVVAIDMHPVQELVFRLEAVALGRDDRDGVAMCGQRRRLGPDPALEGHRQVLDHDQDAPAPAPLVGGPTS